MGARQSRQSVNITTPASGSTCALNATAGATSTVPGSTQNDPATTTTATNASSAHDQPLISSESPEDIKNIVSDTGVSGPGKIEPIPEIDVLPQPVDNAAVAATNAATETVPSTAAVAAAAAADTSVTESMTNQDQSQLSENTMTTTSKGDGDCAATASASETKKTKKLKKKWSFKNLSFSRKKKVLSDSVTELPQSQPQQQNGGDSKMNGEEDETVEESVVAAATTQPEPDNQLLNNSTISATTAAIETVPPASIKRDDSVADSAPVTSITVQETIEEEEGPVGVTSSTVVAAAATAAAEEKPVPMQLSSEKTITVTKTEAVAAVVAEKSIDSMAASFVSEEEPESPSIGNVAAVSLEAAATTTLESSIMTAATTTTDVSLNEKMKNLTINDHENTNGSSAVCFEQKNEVEEMENVHHLNGTAAAAAAAEAAPVPETNGVDSAATEVETENEPEIVEIPVEDDDRIIEEVSTEHCALNGASKMQATNGCNGSNDIEENVPVVAGNGDFVVAAAAAAAADVKESIEIGQDDIAVLKSVQKQVMEEKTQDLLDVEENGLEHNIATEVTNGFTETAAAPALVNE